MPKNYGKNYGGLNVVELKIWNKATMLKLLCNLYRKSDSLWVKWIHTYYIKNDTLMEVKIKTSCSWIMKVILQQREIIENLQCWDQMMHKSKFNIKSMYLALRDADHKVTWMKLFYSNKARPRALMIMWLTCHGKLATKAKLYRC